MTSPFPPNSLAATDKQVVPIHETERIVSARALFELQRDFTFFTLALPYMCAGLDSNLFEDFCHDTGTSPTLIVVKLTTPVVVGLEQNEFERGLFGVPNEIWEKFKPWISSLAISDTRSHAWLPGVGIAKQQPPLLSRIRWQELWVYDPLVLQHKTFLLGEAHPPLVPVWAAVLEQPRGSVYYTNHKPPKAIFDPQLRFLDTTDLGGIDFTSIRSE